MSILVTGGTGYIGSHTVIELLKQDLDVIVIDNFYNSKPVVIDRIKELSGKTFTFYEADILDQEALDRIFSQHEIEAVIHFAGYKAVGESVEKPLAYYRNNIEGTRSLLEVMVKHQVKNIVFSSSATVYGLHNPSPLLENMPAETANSPYGYTKVVNEHMLQDLAVADPEWTITLLRYFNPIGAHESGQIGEDPQGIPNNLMPFITQVAIGKRDQLTVFGDDYNTHDGTGVRDYIHVVDLALGHIKALGRNQVEKGVKIYNLGTGIGYSVLDLIHTFQTVNQVSIPYKISDRRSGDVATCFADVQKAKDELGWETSKNLEDMCRDSWRWQSQNPNGFEV